MYSATAIYKGDGVYEAKIFADNVGVYQAVITMTNAYTEANPSVSTTVAGSSLIVVHDSDHHHHYYDTDPGHSHWTAKKDRARGGNSNGWNSSGWNNSGWNNLGIDTELDNGWDNAWKGWN